MFRRWKIVSTSSALAVNSSVLSGMDTLMYVTIFYVLFFPLARGQCTSKSPPCQLTCPCKNPSRCQSYAPSVGCGNDGCQTARSGQFCQIGENQLGSPGDIGNGYGPEYAVDGNVSTSFVSSSVKNPYLWINTGGYNVINKMKITTGGGIKYFKIEVSDGSDFHSSNLCYKDQSNTPQPVYRIECTQPLIGQYVRIQLPGETLRNLNIKEFEIYACADYWFGGQCDRLCNCQNATEICEKITGSCLGGCAPGYTGPGCQASCEEGQYGSGCKFSCGRCKTKKTCNKVDGSCSKGCATGFTGKKCAECQRSLYGTNCDSQCGHCLNSQQCDRFTGNCPNGCETRYTGKQCKTCEDGRYGPKCESLCGKCGNSKVCNKDDGKCTTGCVLGYKQPYCKECADRYYGIDCSRKCGHCAVGGVCNKDNGNCTNGCEGMFTGDLCKDCLGGFYGKNCSQRCGRCLQSMHCDHDGTCTQGFEPGYQGQLCQNECTDGYYGLNCSLKCGRCRDEEPCNKRNGLCQRGCDGMFSVRLCKECQHGSYGINCTETCGHCFGSVVCHKSNGRCPDGCNPGYDGPLCKDECQSNTFGHKCAGICHCAGGLPCDIQTGECASGTCSDGYSGSSCQDAVEAGDQITDNSAVGAAVGVVIGLILIAVVIVVVVRRRYPDKSARRKTCDEHKLDTVTSSEKEGYFEDETTYINTTVLEVPDTTILAQDLVSTISKKLGKVKILKGEYESLPTGLLEQTNEASKPHNIKKCRYRKIIPYDHTRVVLDTIDDDPKTDFMNASFVKAYGKENAFIASQGPTGVNINEFWRMIWQFEVEKIVMLTNLYEGGKQKVLQYWPNEGVVNYGGISIETVHVDQGVDAIVRTLTLTIKNNHTRTVKQFHYREWPDHGVPRDTTGIILLRENVDRTDTCLDGPVVVHCSAGVGRTGTYIAFNNIMEQLDRETEVDIYQHIIELRHQRTQMVQTVEQYIFLHRIIKDAFLCHGFSLTPEKILAMQSSSPSVAAKLKEELENLRVSRNTDAYKAALDDTNREKNRYVNSIPADADRIWLSGEMPGWNDYINAQCIPGVGAGTKVIVTQIPFGDTRVDFWRLVYQTKSTSIVLLDPDVQSNERYWPSDDTSTTIGPFIVSLLGEVTKENVTLRTLSLTLSSNKYINLHSPVIVEQYSCDYWLKGQMIPDSPGDLITLRNWITSRQRLSECGPIIIHCRDSCQRSGLYCVIHCLLDHLESDSSVNVPLIINRIRQKCVNAISSESQYRYCYDVMQAYLDSFNTYANFT